MKAFTDQNLNLAQKLKSLLEMNEYILGKGENAGTTFSPLPTMFSKVLIIAHSVIKGWIAW